MGPITLFDKSFLQSLSVDESVWFDHFFLANVCPLFYGETLADLDKTVRTGRTPEQEVGIIADKFPEMHGLPCVYHRTLCTAELSGYTVSMTGQVPMASGRLVKSESGKTAVFEPSPEADAFARWQSREFSEIEHQYARDWRREAVILDATDMSDAISALGISEKCRDLSQARTSAPEVVQRKGKELEWLSLSLAFLGVPAEFCQQTFEQWIRSGRPALIDFAPYTAYVLEVEVFFRNALASKLISRERSSNRLDIAYLFYLPFCDMFVSNDRLHQRCAPLFLRPDQEFVWGPDLKANLRQINEYYLKLPDFASEQGVLSLTDDPPAIGNGAVRNLWKKLLPRWREVGEEIPGEARRHAPTAREIRELAEAPPMVTSSSDWVSGELDQMVVKRLVKQKKGSWYQIPARIDPGEVE